MTHLIQKLKESWRRFWALPWRWKGPALSGAGVLVAVAIVVVTVAVASGGGDDDEIMVQQPTATADRPTPTPAPSPTPSPTPAPTPAPTPRPPAAAPVAGGYTLTQALPSATFSGMLGFAPIPGSGSEGVVVTQDGTIWRVPLSGSGPAAVYGDLSGLLISDPGFEEGLLGLAFSPGFQSDGRVYVYYTAGGPRRSVLSRFQVVGGAIDLGSETVLLEVPQPFENHNGGQLAFGPDGYLYVALGDGGSGGDPNGNGQNLSTLLGSILRLDVSGVGYTVPPSNPFGSEIYAYGLRNPWRFSFDRANGDLWAADVGQDQWEEVDRIVAGGNYGWNVIEGFECFIAASCDQGGLRLPRAVYGRDLGCSVTGGYVYRGASMPELDGWYVYGDFCSGLIWAVNTADDSSPVLLAETGLPIASFGELPDGELLVLTFANAVYRLARSP